MCNPLSRLGRFVFTFRCGNRVYPSNDVHMDRRRVAMVEYCRCVARSTDSNGQAKTPECFTM